MGGLIDRTSQRRFSWGAWSGDFFEEEEEETRKTLGGERVLDEMEWTELEGMEGGGWEDGSDGRIDGLDKLNQSAESVEWFFEEEES